MSNYDEELRYAQGGDTGEGDSDSIQPISDTERLYRITLDRQETNLRQRTEIIRTAVKQLMFESDYQRSLILSSTGLFALIQHANGYEVTATAELRVVPALVPNAARSGGRVTSFPSGATLSGARLISGANPYLGTATVNDLWIFADPSFTGQRAYADGTDMNVLSVKSIGANDISFELVIDGGLGPGTIVIDPVTGIPTRHIRVRYGDGTTIGQLRNAINTDHVGGGSQSQGGGTWGIGEMIHAETTNNPPITALTGANLISCSPIVLQGSYDAEVHVVTAAQLATFFTTATNRLQDGETLVLAYPAGPVQPGSGGGRRQSLIDFPTSRLGVTSDNTGRLAAGAGMLVNGGLHPEQIPGAIPIGRLIQGQFRFVDGTIVQPNVSLDVPGTALSLGESAFSLTRLAATTDPDGASLIGYDGSPNWDADLAVPPLNVPSGALGDVLDAIVTQLASEAANGSGARRLGAEPIAGVADGPTLLAPGNNALSLITGSIRQQLAALLNQAGSSSTAGGMNSRVSEWGHTLRGPNPIEKDFNQALGTFGQQFVRSTIQPHVLFGLPHGNINEEAIAILQPISAIGGLVPFQAIDHSGAGISTNEVHLNPFTDGQATFITNLIPNTITTGANSNPVGNLFHTVVQLQGIGGTGTGLNGYYYYTSCRSGGADVHFISLKNLDGTNPNFSGGGVDFTSAVATFYFGLLIGSDIGGRRIRAFLPAVVPPRGGGTYQGGGGTAPIMLSVPSDPTHPGEQSVIDMFIPGSVENANSIWMATIAPRRAIWSGTDSGLAFPMTLGAGLLDPDAVVRNTDNILIKRDADLLKGNELALAVNATTNHIHDDRYETIADAAATYETQVHAAATYETITAADTHFLRFSGTPQASITIPFPNTGLTLSHGSVLTDFPGVATPSGWIDLISVATLNGISPFNVSGTFTRQGMRFTVRQVFEYPGNATPTAFDFAMEMDFAWDNTTATPTRVTKACTIAITDNTNRFLDYTFDVVVPWVGAAGAATQLQANLITLTNTFGGPLTFAAQKAQTTMSITLQEDWQIRTA